MPLSSVRPVPCRLSLGQKKWTTRGSVKARDGGAGGYLLCAFIYGEEF